jgi:hypothetical protein
MSIDLFSYASLFYIKKEKISGAKLYFHCMKSSIAYTSYIYSYCAFMNPGKEMPDKDTNFPREHFSIYRL